MDVQRWICFSNGKTAFVKIVHPGGHVELHDRPVLASEILNRNPRSCVAHPNIFRQPWAAAVVEPETTLMPGQKFYVVPQHTLRRLQSLLASESSSPGVVPAEFPTPQNNREKVSTCSLLFRRNGSSKSDSDTPPPKSGGCLGRRRWRLTRSRTIARSDRDDDEMMSSPSSLGSSDMKSLPRNKGGALDSTSAAAKL